MTQSESTYRQRRASNYADFDNPPFARRVDFWTTWAKRLILTTLAVTLVVMLVVWWAQ